MPLSDPQTIVPPRAIGDRWKLGWNVGAIVILAVLGWINVLAHLRVPALIGWLPAGAALALIVLHGPRILPGIVAGAFLATLAISGAAHWAAANALAYALACLAVWWLVVSGRSDAVVLGVRPLGRLLLAGSAAFSLVAVLLNDGSVPRLFSGIADHHTMGDAETGLAHHHGESGATGHPVRHDFLEWLLSEPIGVLLVIPVVLYLSHWRHRETASDRAIWMPWLALSALLFVTVAVYSGFIERHFSIVHTTLLVLPVAVWVALEYGATFTLSGNLAVLSITAIGTAMGFGPFKDHTAGLPLLTVAYLVTTLMIMASRAERRRAESDIYRLATRDALTGLTNRSAFLERAEQALATARRYGRRLGLLFIDLDHFKNINDTLGHHAGDRLLIESATRIQGCLRKESVLARFGGDELVILVAEPDNDQVLTGIAERIAEVMMEPFDLAGRPCVVSCSIGISRFPEDGDSVSDLVMKADIAMYEVKTTGRNGYRVYSEGMAGFLRTDRRVSATPLAP